MNSYLVPPAAVSDVRAGVRALATEYGKDTDVRRAVAGVRLLESALAEPHGYFDNKVAEEHVRQWHDEDTATLDALATVALETCEPVVRLQVREAASRIARYSGDKPLAKRASSLIAAIDERSEDLLSSAIIASFRDLVPWGEPCSHGIRSRLPQKNSPQLNHAIRRTTPSITGTLGAVS